MIREFICKGCNKKCILTIEDNDYKKIKGNECNLGIDYGKLYNNSTKGIFTSLVRVKGSKNNIVPVKTTRPIDRSLWIACSKALSRLYVGAPIKIGDIICKNILNTGVDIVCTKNIYKE
ncbi:DUF1667 domain-containing protein [Clostridium niameyense]|uniref:DUF1667 domain-containing protein n=1 Tax=Clostridium niameyense TaxID=1622073 RepID=A0A6M0RCI1_9CLOT|nr:DUF1667 domain-containing protein [Clostridium niameyense]NEZ48011.1 DUF1667 domain-containing protein [Clostridium niameyense]